MAERNGKKEEEKREKREEAEEMTKVQVFNLKSMGVQPYESREKNIFFQAKEFKTRLVELPPGGEIPSCKMSTYVVFYVIAGSAEVQVDEEVFALNEGHCLVAPPATLKMRTTGGVKILGIQIEKA